MKRLGDLFVIVASSLLMLRRLCAEVLLLLSAVLDFEHLLPGLLTAHDAGNVHVVGARRLDSGQRHFLIHVGNKIIGLIRSVSRCVGLTNFFRLI